MPHTDHSLGDVVGRYRLLGEMARGGMGIVYVAAAQGPAGFSKLVALKELRPDLVEDEEFLTMFLEEARMAARLNHPNIVQTNDVDESHGRHFIAMEYLEGRSLYHVVKRFGARGGFPQRMALSVLRDVLSALDYAHELTGFDGKPLGFVHRDVSPHNIFLTFEGHTKVIDFGIAKARDSSLETKTGVLKGRANYMAATGGAPRHRDLADALAQEFDAERQRLRALIEAALFRLQAGESGRLEALDFRDPRDAGHDSRRSRNGTSSGSRSGKDHSLHTASSISAVRHTPSTVGYAPHSVAQQTPSALRDLPGVNLSSVVRAGGTLPTSPAELLEPLEPASLLTRIWQGQPWAVTGAFALIFVATTALVALHHPAPQQAEPILLPPPLAAPAPVARPSGPEMIVFSVSVTPSTAQIAIDGQLMPSNPFVGHFQKSGTAHRVRATAAGHSAKERLVTFDDNVMIDLSLTPAAPAPAPAPAAAHASNGGERSSSRRSEQS
ncbi:MAG: serine/threonine protein kinase, partial [Myxococcales bacterium]|nr:serine/threonine protein kinase [Myxococcales bacterium]